MVGVVTVVPLRIAGMVLLVVRGGGGGGVVGGGGGGGGVVLVVRIVLVYVTKCSIRQLESSDRLFNFKTYSCRQWHLAT